MSIYSNIDDAINALKHIRQQDPLFFRGYIYEYILDNSEHKECIYATN